jgi:phage/plasmid primase-like uncharacterized protein
LIFHCWGADCAFGDIVAALREEQIDIPSCGIASAMAQEDDPQRRIDRALSLYWSAVPASGTIVETYLRSRGITLPVPEVLRFLPYAPHRDQRSYPAMIAPVVNAAGDPVGVHLTYLAPGGNGKYPFAAKSMQRECRGPIRGGGVRPADVSRSVSSVNTPQLLVAEGIETTLSCMQLFGIPSWAALSAPGVAALELPPEIKSVVIACDNDINNASHHAATAAYYRWVAERRAVQLIMPPMPGTDFNDVLTERGGRNE